MNVHSDNERDMMLPLQIVTCQAAFYFYIDASNRCYMVLTLDEPGTYVDGQKKSIFAIDVVGSDDMISGVVQEAVMDDATEQVKAAKDSGKLPLGRCSLGSRDYLK